jgi:hypothetical protein
MQPFPFEWKISEFINKTKLCNSKTKLKRLIFESETKSISCRSKNGCSALAFGMHSANYFSKG